MYTYFSQYSNIVPLFFFFVPIISLVYTIGFFLPPSEWHVTAIYKF